MIITISGMPGSGKSTLGKRLAKALGIKHYSTGTLWRGMAKKRGISVVELNKIAKTDKSIDRQIDSMSGELGKMKDNFVMDSRLAWHFIPDSVKIFLRIDEKVAAERVFAEKRQDEKGNKTLEKTLENIRKRHRLERERYKKLYGVDYLDEKNYDIVIDNTGKNIEETAEEALKAVRQYIKKE